MDVSKDILALLDGLQPAFRSHVKDSLAAFDRNFERIARSSTLEDAVFCLTGSIDLLSPLAGSKVTQSQLLNNPHLEYHTGRYRGKVYKVSLAAQCGAETRSFFGRKTGLRRSAVISLKILAKLVDREKNPQSFELYQHALQLIGNQARLLAELRIVDHDANCRALVPSDDVYQFSLDILRATFDHIERFPYLGPNSDLRTSSPGSMITSLNPNASSSTVSATSLGPAGSILELEHGGTQNRLTSKTMSPEQQQLTSQITKTDKQVRLPPHLTKTNNVSPQTPPLPSSQQNQQQQQQNQQNQQQEPPNRKSNSDLEPPPPPDDDTNNPDHDDGLAPLPSERLSTSQSITPSLHTAEPELNKPPPIRPAPMRMSTVPRQQPTNLGSSPPHNVARVDQSNKSVFSKLKDKFTTKAPYQSIRKQSTIIHDGILFGRSLEALVADEMCDDSHVPYFLIIVGQYLLSDDSLCEQEGIFRVPGNVAKITQLKQSLDYNHVFRPQDCDVHDLCNIIKVWLRELPEPLIPHALLPPLVEAFQAGDEMLVFALLNSAQIPVCHRATLHYLLRIGAHITAPRFKKFNNMSTQSIAVVLAPNIFRARPGTTNADLPRTQQDMSSAVAILMLLLESVRSDLPTDSLGTVGNAATHGNATPTQITVTDTGMVVGDLALDEIPDMDTSYLQYNQVRPSLVPPPDDPNYSSTILSQSTSSQPSDSFGAGGSSPPQIHRRGSVLSSDQFEYKGPAKEQYQRRPTLAVPPSDETIVHHLVTKSNSNSNQSLPQQSTTASPALDPKAHFEILKQQLEQQGGVDVENIRQKQDKHIIYKEGDHYVDVSLGLELYGPQPSTHVGSRESSNNISNSVNQNNNSSGTRRFSTSSPSTPTLPLTSSTSSTTSLTLSPQHPQQQQQQQQQQPLGGPGGRQRAANPEMATPTDPANRPIPVNMRTALDTIPEWQRKKLQNLPLPTVPPTTTQSQPSTNNPDGSPVPLDQRPLPLRPDQLENTRILTQEHRRSSVVERDHSVPRPSNPTTGPQHPQPSESQPPVGGRDQSIQPYYALPRGHRGSVTGANPVHINPRRSISQAPPGFRRDESIAASAARVPLPSLSAQSPAQPSLQLPQPTSSTAPIAATTAITTTTSPPHASTSLTNHHPLSSSSSVQPNASLFGANSQGMALGRKVGKKNYYVPGRGNTSTQGPSFFSSGLNVQPAQYQQPVQFASPALQLPPTPTTNNPNDFRPVASRLRQNRTGPSDHAAKMGAKIPTITPAIMQAELSTSSDSEEPPPPPGSQSPTSKIPINQPPTDDFDPNEAGEEPLQLPQPTIAAFKPVRIRNSVSYDSSNRVISENVQSEATNSLGGPLLKISTSFNSKTDDLPAIGEDSSATPTLSRHLSSPRTNSNGAFAFGSDRSAEIIAQSTGVSVQIVRERGQSFLPPKDLDELALGWEEYQESGVSYYHHIATNSISYIRPCWRNRDKVKLIPDPIQTSL